MKSRLLLAKGENPKKNDLNPKIILNTFSPQPKTRGSRRCFMSENWEADYRQVTKLAVQRTKHEQWVKAAIQTARVEILNDELSVITQMKCDLVFRVGEADPFWADIGELIEHGEVIFEHHSNSISRKLFNGCVIKQASYLRDRRQQGLPAKERAPCLIMTCHQFPRTMLKYADFKSTGTPGIYTQGGRDNLLILIVTSLLPRDALYNFLRLLSRAPGLDEIDSLEDKLMEVRELSRIERENLKEAAVAQTAQDKEARSAIKRIAKRHVELEISIEEKEAVLQQLNVVLQEKDEALQEKDEALQEKDEALRRAMEEIERMKKLLNQA